MGNVGKALAALGCLTWLGCGGLGMLLAFGAGFLASIVGAENVGLVSSGGYGSLCCASLGFLMFFVGIVLVLVGGGNQYQDV